MEDYNGLKQDSVDVEGRGMIYKLKGEDILTYLLNSKNIFAFMLGKNNILIMPIKKDDNNFKKTYSGLDKILYV